MLSNSRRLLLRGCYIIRILEGINLGGEETFHHLALLGWPRALIINGTHCYCIMFGDGVIVAGEDGEIGHIAIEFCADLSGVVGRR